MSSATAWTGSMTSRYFRKSDSELFQTLVAAAAKVLFPRQLEVRWTVNVLVSAERSSLARASLTSWKSSARYPGTRPDKDRWTSVAILNNTRCRTGNQCSWRSTGEIWSHLLAPVANLAAAFCTDCRRHSSSFVMPKTEHYNSPGDWQWKLGLSQCH